jgi:hypothetical protein
VVGNILLSGHGVPSLYFLSHPSRRLFFDAVISLPEEACLYRCFLYDIDTSHSMFQIQSPATRMMATILSRQLELIQS